MTKKKLVSSVLFLFTIYSINGQTAFIRADSAAPNILTFSFSGGSFENYGCDSLDPAYWLSGKGDTVTVDFATVQTNPSLRVWGMNDDDSAIIYVNNLAYPLTATSAKYDDKVICNSVYGSPGPDGVTFSLGLLVGVNNNTIGNYSYQNVTLLNSNINSLKIIGISGNGWGFAGITILDLASNIDYSQEPKRGVKIFPNPAVDKIHLNSIYSLLFSGIIYDSNGRVILEEKRIRGNTIDVSSLTNGIYHLVLTSENRQESFTFIKK